VLAWAASALQYTTPQAAYLVGAVAVGSAAGAILASVRVQLDQAARVIPIGIIMGLWLAAMVLVRHPAVAVFSLLMLGMLGGYVVVPMNALLQHRGHNLMGAGNSIAVQNLNEQLAILGLGMLYTFATKQGLSAFGSVIVFGCMVAASMFGVGLWYLYNLRRYKPQVEHLLQIARKDCNHIACPPDVYKSNV
jgi:hypothetical protein